MFSDFKRFLFFLDDGSAPEPQQLETGPDGWIDTQIQFQRSATYWGVNRLLTLPLKFVGKGRHMIRNAFYRQLIGATLLFTLWMLDDTGFAYSEIYSGRLDMTKYEGSIGSVSVPAIDNDFRAKINAYEATKFSISLNQPSAINLELTPIALNEIANLLPSGPPDGVLHADYFPPIQVVNNQQNSVQPSVQDVQYGQLRDPDFSAVPNWFFDCQHTGKLLVTGTLECVLQATGSHHVKLAIYDNTGAVILDLIEITGSVVTIPPPIELVKAYAGPGGAIRWAPPVNMSPDIVKLLLFEYDTGSEDL